jgi:hypothetical protein
MHGRIMDGPGDLISLEREWTLEGHFEGSSDVQKEMMRGTNQHKPCGQTKRRSNGRANHGVLSLVRWSRDAG